jgi:hypothetical protein
VEPLGFIAVSVPSLETDPNPEPDADHILQFFLNWYKVLPFQMLESVLFPRKLASRFLLFI